MRIVSLAPFVSETLFALGLDAEIVGLLMKAPEKSQPMIGAVPEVRNEIQSDHAQGNRDPVGRGHLIQQAQAAVLSPHRDRARAAGTDDSEHERVQRPKRHIGAPASFETPVRAEALEANREGEGEDETDRLDDLELGLRHSMAPLGS